MTPNPDRTYKREFDALVAEADGILPGSARERALFAAGATIEIGYPAYWLGCVCAERGETDTARTLQELAVGYGVLEAAEELERLDLDAAYLDQPVTVDEADISVAKGCPAVIGPEPTGAGPRRWAAYAARWPWPWRTRLAIAVGVTALVLAVPSAVVAPSALPTGPWFEPATRDEQVHVPELASSPDRAPAKTYAIPKAPRPGTRTAPSSPAPGKGRQLLRLPAPRLIMSVVPAPGRAGRVDDFLAINRMEDGRQLTTLAPMSPAEGGYRRLRLLVEPNTHNLVGTLWSAGESPCTWRFVGQALDGTAGIPTTTEPVSTGRRQRAVVPLGDWPILSVEVTGGGRPEGCLLIDPRFVPHETGDTSSGGPPVRPTWQPSTPPSTWSTPGSVATSVPGTPSPLPSPRS